MRGIIRLALAGVLIVGSVGCEEDGRRQGVNAMFLCLEASPSWSKDDEANEANKSVNPALYDAHLKQRYEAPRFSLKDIEECRASTLADK